MPREEIFHKFKHGTLRSSSGAKVTDRDQAIAIAMSYAPAKGGDHERRASEIKRRHKRVLDGAKR